MPSAAEESKGTAESHGVKVGRNSAEAGPVKVQGGTGEGDKVTLVATVTGNCGKEPHWVIKELDPRPGAPRQDAMIPGQTAHHSFLPPHVPLAGAWPFPFDKNILWLEGVHPRRYSVTCKAPRVAPQAHHLLEVWAYPSNSSTLTLDSKAIKKPPWEAKIDGLKDKFEELFNHAAALIPQLPKAKIELLEGKVKLTNGWEEVPESNLARWKAGVSADVELVSVALEFQVSIFKFLKAAESVAKAVAEVNKIREFFEKRFGLYIEAGLFLTVKISLALKGEGGWEKEVGGKAVPHLESLKMEEGASITLEARLDVGYKKDGAKGELVSMSGKATTELTLSSSPRLESGGGANPHFWLDSEFEWKPLTLTLEAKVHAPIKRTADPPEKPVGKGLVQGKTLNKADVHNAEAAPPASSTLLSLSWTGEVLPKVKKELPSLDLLTGETGARPAGESGKPLAVVPRPAPPVKPAAPAAKLPAKP